MPRAIIQDSDDDGEFGSVSPVSEKARTPLIRDVSSRSQKSAPGGTSSTEAIQREIAAAHREVLEKSAAATHVFNGHDSSPRIHRRNTTLETGHGPSPTNPRRRSTMVTYGSSSRRGQGTFEDEAFDFMKEPKVGRDAQFGSSPGDVEFVVPRGPIQRSFERNEEQNLIGGSLQPDFAGHEPRMFGTSDTVPDGTMDQQRLLDAAMADFANTHGPAHTELSGVRVREKSLGEDPSPPWSDYLHSPEVPQQMSSSASTKKRRSSVAVTGSQSSMPSAKRHRPQVVDDKDELANLDDPFVTNTQKVVYSIKDSIHAVRASRAAKEAKAQQDTSSEPLNGEDVLIGLPKERYQPRPSRSRSSRLSIEEPIDYSANPDKASKKKAKRRKTEDSATIGRVKLSASERRERMIGIEFSPTSSKRALKECKDDLDEAVEALSNADHKEPSRVENADQFDVVANHRADVQAVQDSKSTIPRTQGSPIVLIEKTVNSGTDSRNSNKSQPKKKRGRPPKVRPLEEKTEVLADVTYEARASHDEAKTEDHIKNTILEIEEHQQSVSSLERRVSPTVNPTPPSSAQPNKLEERAAEIPEAQVPLPKKRGRGRPRKQKSPEPTTPNRHEATESDMQATRGGEMPQAPNSEEPEKQTPGRGSIREAPVSTPHNVTSSQTRSELQPSTANALETPEKAPAKAASRSSASTSKVSYRVGLSRRARIAPLLKIVKK
ncbi:hypothetical protein IWZ00DRAFT_254961 [Phyllosticta capitalensis]